MIFRRTQDILKLSHNLLLSLVPKCRLGDSIISTVNFVIRNKRFPSNTNRFNDRIHFNKTSSYALRPDVGVTSCKYLSKIFVNSFVDGKNIVPTISALWSVEEVLKFDFPDRCAIKATHSSGQVIIRKNGEPVDRAIISSWLDENYYPKRREANYRYLRPGIIVEPLVFNNASPEDFKIFCFKGRACIIQVDTDRHISHSRAFFDRDWNRLPFSLKAPISTKDINRPGCLDDMITAAESISTIFDLVRIDFFSDGTHFFVGEITHFHGNGWEQFTPPQGELIMNEAIFGQIK